MAEKKKNYQIKPEDKVAFSQKWLYSLASLALIPGMQIIDRIALVVLNMGLGIGPVLSAVTMAVFRIWDAFTDPFFGNLSDNYRSKWGRRRPFIVLGGIICAITFPLLWMMSREWTPILTIIYFIGVGLAYYTALTIYSVPYFSLACEMTPDTHERTNVLGFRQIVINVVTVGMGWLLWFITLDCFSDELEGTRWLAGITSLLFLTFGIIPMLYVKEPFYAQAEKQERVPFWGSCKATLTNGVAMLLVTMMLLMTIAMQSVGTIGFYVSTYYVFGGDKSSAGLVAGYGGTAMMILSTVTIPLFTWLSRKLGKIPTLYICGASYLFATLSQWWLITPEHPYWQIISAALIGPAVTGTWLILPSMQTDVIDYDELKTGCRREGSYTAILGWIQKLGFSLAAILAGVILKVSGFEVALEGAQTADTLMRMRMLYVFFPIAMAGVMLLLVRFYPLNEQRCHEIRLELEKRRGELHGTKKVDGQNE
ncbi:MFS transporter [Pontiellaceae bacterium B12227]|nr:MFS transporter [Pontiellaceae bacterium B12227]